MRRSLRELAAAIMLAGAILVLDSFTSVRQWGGLAALTVGWFMLMLTTPRADA